MSKKKKLEMVANITLGESVCVVIGEHREMTAHVIEDIPYEEGEQSDVVLLLFADGGGAQVEKKDLYDFAQGKPVKNPINGQWVVLRKEDEQ
ncbi:MAG: hypothetical protein LUC16_02135 [Coprobacillus sp.]|nr:hypothetical protein [Coprobacillus sp.]